MVTEDLVYSDEELMRSPDYSFMSVEEKYSEGVRKACLIVKRMRQHNLNNYMDAFLFRWYSSVSPRAAGIHPLVII